MSAEANAALPEIARRLVRTTFGERATEPRALASGEWSQAFELSLDGAEAVLRIGAHGTDFAKDEIAAGLAGPHLPVPAMLTRGMVEGWHYAISARAHGTAFDDLSADDATDALPPLLNAIDDIGRMDLTSTTGYGIWTPDRRAPYTSWVDALLAIGTETARVPGWRAALADSDIGLGPFEAGLTAIAALAPYLPAERRMIHGDLLSRNVLVADGNVSAVLDWGNAMYGDSLYDAAWLIYWWPWYPDWRTIDINAALLAHWRATGPLPANLRERLHAYLIHIGLDAIAYCTFQRRWDEVRANAETVVALAESAPGEIGLE
ncbi:aminoglycoside phosphotransferase family protein [Kribbella sp. NPDC049227]|uniref:aminoglycoside phosphotransferase family protein n=1 Tax=Kribbella sp. NPDC049227 TaxID=3364113 RepID=UPI0037169FBB